MREPTGRAPSPVSLSLSRPRGGEEMTPKAAERCPHGWPECLLCASFVRELARARDAWEKAEAALHDAIAREEILRTLVDFYEGGHHRTKKQRAALVGAGRGGTRRGREGDSSSGQPTTPPPQAPRGKKGARKKKKSSVAPTPCRGCGDRGPCTIETVGGTVVTTCCSRCDHRPAEG